MEVPFTGQLLLERSLFNKGTAFTPAERRELGLLGLLPPHHETLHEQVTRAYEAYHEKTTDLERHIYLRQLQDSNATLFYRLLLDHLAELMPIIYTPTVGLACERYSHIIRRPRGLFIAYPERDDIDTILENASSPQVEVIVVTDGERILGLGDQGAGGMGIPIGKLAIYTACGGIHPATTLPILLDPGTNNQERLDDPLYIGWRHERVTGAEYDAFVDAFVQAVKRKFPGVLLQWEDFAQHNAYRLLERYRDQLCTFNDDIQGTAAVTTGALLAAVGVTGRPLREHTVAILGAGSAGCGIAEQLVAAMVEQGLPEADARGTLLPDRPPGPAPRRHGRPPAVPAEAGPAQGSGDRMATRRGRADRPCRCRRARASDDPDRRLGPAAHLHRGGDPRDGPLRRAADHLPALEPDLASRGDSGRADRLDGGTCACRHRQPVR